MSRWTRIALAVPFTACSLDTGSVDTFGSGYSVGDVGEHDDDGSEGDTGDDDGVESGPVDEGPAEDGGPVGPGEGDCCIGHETPGCGDEATSTCVCAQDPFCCDTKWDELCSTLVEKYGCGLCDAPTDEGPAEEGPVEDDGGIDDGGGTDDGGGLDDGGGVDDGGGTDDGGGELDDGGGEVDDGAGAGDCCTPNGGTGCGDAMIESCVCESDAYCCDTEWDDICVGEVDSFGCGDCGGGGGTTDPDPDPTDAGGTDDGGGGGGGECCVPSTEPGCADPTVESCVCAEDSYCCATAWDDICVGEVDSFGCGTCGGAGDDAGADDGAVDVGDCCDAHAAGCSDPTIEACVCAEDAYCCETEWDGICIGEVDSLGCAVCP